ncbi:Ig-like domain-containing protein [uncultured Treponema sp.]|uniref:Ig-like domain-containing protein n=1 Tax=uncultured Treponema sp. TaxID=162155 RepID=UPI0027D9C8CF|nr:Ig-like domain-containing protein [uncultured Treponema sp.]
MKVKKFLLAVVSVVFAYALLSCDVGLGAAVDTQAPTLNVTYPATLSTVRGQFVFGGTCADDQKVTSVTVSAYNSELGKSYGPFAATIADDAKSWTFSFNKKAEGKDSYNGWEMPDGKYTLEAVARDASGKSSGTGAITIDIDNTEPIFILNSPGTTDIKNPTVSGSSFKITGTIADDHSIKYMRVNVYENMGGGKGKLLESFKEENIETSGGTSVSLFGKKDDVYTKLYGDIKDASSIGTKTFFCEIELEDSAYEYNDFKNNASGKTGNVSKKVYLYDSVYQKFQSSSGYGLEAAKIKSIVNETLTEVNGTAAAQIRTEFLNSAAQSSLAFGLNPNANPKYVVQGFDVDSVFDINKTGASSQSISVQVNAGLDGTNVLPETMCVYVFGPFDSVTENIVSSIYNDPAEYAENKDAPVAVKEANSSYEGSSLATYTFNIKLPKTISPLKTYIVAASGEDADGNDFDNDGTVFAFRGAQTGAAPALAINTPTNSAMFNSSKDLSVTGTVGYDGGIDENNLSLAWEVTITDENADENDPNRVVRTYSGTRDKCKVSTVSENNASWSFSIPADDVPAYDADKKNGKVYTYSVKVTATGSNKLKAVAERSFHVDLKPPVLSGPEVTKTVKNAAGSDCVNGTIYISGGVDENYRKTFTLTVTDSSDSGVKKEFSYNAGQFNSEPIDTTEFKDGANLIITLAAEDKAGNKSEPSVKTIKIDQSTDRPVVAITNASADVKADEIAVGKNLFNSTTNSTLNITVTDDDGISAPVIVNAYALTSGGTADKKNAVHTEEFKDFTIGTTSANLTFNLPKTEGKYAVEVTARDTLYETATKENKVNHENTSGITYYVAVDNGAPSLSIESKSGAYQVQDADFIVTGKVSDTSGARLFVSSENINSIPAASDTKSIEITPKTGTSFTTKVNAGTTSGTKYFVAFDAYGQRTSTEFKWKVDGKAPTIAPDFPFKPDPESWFNSSAVGILLPLADSWDKDIEKVIDDPSNISSVIATFTAADGTEKATPLTLGGAYSADKYENQYYKYSTTLNFDADAKYDVSVTATDNAGNKGVFGPYKYNIDTTAPTVTVGDYVANLTGKEMNDENFAYKIPVTVSDTLSGIKSVTVKKGNEVLTKGTDYTETVTGDVYTFEFKKDVLTTGTYAFTFTAEDNAGNTSEASANVSVDKIAPAITVKGVSPVVAAAGGNKVNGKITVTGTVTDETKLGTTGAVTLNIKKTDGDGTSAKTAKTDLSGGTYGEWSFVIDTTTLTDNSTYTLEVTAVDAVGNTETKSTTINVDQSTDIPSITPSNYDAGINSADGVGVKGDVIKNLFGTVSNNKLSGTASDDDGVKTVTVEYREAGSTGAYISKKVIENGTSTTAPFTFALPSKEAKYEVKITVTDTEGNANGTYAASPFYIGVSSGAPALKVDPQTSDYTRKGEVLSVKPTVTSNVATTLTASYTVKRETTTETVTVATGTITPDGKGNISLTVPATVKDKDVLAITYTATDIFGQSTSDVHTYTIDNTAPVLASAFYSSNDLKPTVNKKDPASSWYKDESLPFDIKYYDGGCGVERVEYTFTPQGGTAVTGSGIPKIVTVDGKKYYQYTAAISGFAVGTNTLVFTAVDAAGNKSTSTTLNVRCDNVAPSLELVSIDDETAYDGRGKLVNGTKDVKFIVKATDEASGIASVKYGNVEGTADQSGQYSFTIKSKSLATMDVNATATDQAGNTTTTKLFNIILDNVAPVVNITSSLDKDTSTPAVEVNGTIALEGNSNDGSYALTATPVFWYTLTKPTDPVTSTAGWTRIFTGTSDITESSTPTAWKSLPIDTKSAFGTLTDGTHVYVMAAVTDSAQNTGYSPVLDLVVDQNTDRPQIKITSPKSLKDMGKTGTTIWQKNTKVIEGRISDDDGIESLEYSFKDPNDETFDSSIDWIEVTPNGDSWEIEAKEGENKIYFRVTDTEGTIFTSSKTSGLTAPYITDGKNKFGTAAAADSVLYVTVDTIPPAIRELKFDTTATKATYTGPLKDVSLLSNTIVGGTTKWLKIRAHATDDNGIKSVTVSINNGAAVEATKGSDEEGEYYELADIDLSGLPSGSIDAVVTAKDNAGTTSSTTLKINVDNTAPELKVTYPGTDTASKVIRKVTMKGIASDNNAGIESIKYKMGKSTSTKYDWEFITKQMSWELPFESTTQGDPKNILYYITEDMVDAGISEEETPGSALYKVYVSFLVTDVVGNQAVVDGNYILVDAEGGKPIATVIYPETGATVGGSLTIIGTATDDSGVSEVQVQLDVNNDGNFDETDYNIIKSWTASDGTTPSMPGLCETYSADWYITATGTNSWKLLVPTMEIAENTALADKGMSLRVRAWDNDETPQTRGWGKTVKVKIDVKAPQVENVALVQYKSGSSGETSVSRTYSSGMYITKPETGKDWYLTGTISSTSLSSVTITSDAESVNKISFNPPLPSVTPDGKYTFSAPVTIIGDGKTSATINVSGESGYTTTYPVLFSVDSQAPQMYSKDGSLAEDKTTSLRLKSGGINVDESNAVVNSNVVYTFGDVVKEEGSGLDYIAFYFKRSKSGGTEPRVYNPMFNTNGDNRTDIDTTKTAGTASGDTYINSDGLPVMYMKDAARSTETSFSHSSISGNKNIRVGGLIKIGGSYVRISSVDKDKDEVTFAPAKAESFTEAEFVYAQIVDHEITEGPTGNDYENVSNDDGDGMIETLKAEGSKYTWTACIFSDRIPDGPVEIHVVTIDKAGNINRGSIATSIQNKRPRIAKVLLGTDLDHNGTYDFYSDSEIKYEGNVTQATYNNRNFGEFNYYSAVDATNKAQSSVTLSSKTFKIKNGMCILPEFIGGNGTLKYNMIVGDRAAEEAQKGTDTLETLTTGTDSLKVADRDGTKANIEKHVSSQGGIILTNKELEAHESTTEKYFAFTFWDETEETVQGTDSQWALLNIPVIVDVKDDTPPNASFKPFFWNGKGRGNNSLAYDSTTGKALGHIELESDLTAALKVSPYGTGPKVSGTIVLRGTASDETLLTGLSVKAASVKAAETEIASAKYENGVWSSANGLTVTNVREVDQNGHEVTWELEYETPSAQKELDLTVTATDGGTNSSPEATESTAPALGTKEEKRTALYTVDVVPYVTNVKTMLSTVGGKEEAAWSTYGRTSTGAYVAGQSWAKNTGITGEKSGSAETVTLYGFNLAGGTVESSNGGSATLSTVSDTDNSFSFSVSGFKSGDYTVTAVNGIPSINNINSNDSKGSYKGSEAAQKYNRMPNGTTNNNLTDDFKMNIWDIRYDAATSQGGTLKEAVMRIAPDSNNIGFAFTNGASKFSMGGSKSGNSYQIWQSNYADFNNVSFVYDKNGNSYGTATGLDTYPNGSGDFAGRFTFMSSQWGICSATDMDDNYYGTNKLRMESIGIKESKVQGSDQNTCIMDTYRFRSPTLATTMHGNSTSVYLAYYDTFQRQIRFRYGTFKTDAVGQSKDENNNNNGFDQFTDQVRANNSGGKTAFDAKKDTYSLIAGKDADNTKVDTGNVCRPSNSMASTCVAIDAIEGSSTAEDVVVAAWCTGSGVAFAYKKNPYTDNDADSDSANAGTAGYWSKAVEVFSGACEDVSIKADASGAVHISAYNKADQSLVYRYINKDRTTMGDVVTVDSYQIVGSRTQIDVQKEVHKKVDYYVPYISYYNPATQKTKLAYLIAGKSDKGYSAQGVKSDDTFTGNWEVSVIPTSSDIQEDHTNIGLWKDSSGARRTSVGGTVNNYGSIGDNEGQTSGNGTNNPVVGYATVIGIRGFIETAQMR